MRGRNPETFGQSLGIRGKWALALIGVALLAAATGVGIWSSVHPGSYNSSRNGCVNFNVPSTMGGSLIHACGGRARTLCQHAFSHTDKLSRLTRDQCRQARLGPAVPDLATPAASP